MGLCNVKPTENSALLIFLASFGSLFWMFQSSLHTCIKPRAVGRRFIVKKKKKFLYI